MSSIKLFQDKKIRSIWNEEEEQWYFSVVDVIEALTDSPNPRQYWRKMKDRDLKDFQLYPNWVQLKMLSTDGKKYNTDCANAKGVFRIIQSIPSHKAEPFKVWLASVGYERLQEIENPELAQERMKILYEQRDTQKIGLTSVCEALPFGRISPMSGKNAEFPKKAPMPFLQQRYQKPHSASLLLNIKR